VADGLYRGFSVLCVCNLSASTLVVTFSLYVVGKVRHLLANQCGVAVLIYPPGGTVMRNRCECGTVEYRHPDHRLTRNFPESSDG